jgi:hypothetical protein
MNNKKEEIKENTQTKLGVYEEEDFFEEFDDEGNRVYLIFRLAGRKEAR